MKLTIEVPCVPISGNKRASMHWASRKRIADAWRVAVLACTDFSEEAARELHHNAKSVNGTRKVRVSVTCYFCAMQKKNPHLPSVRGKRLDKDNLINGLKPAYDAVKRAGLIKDDSPRYIEHGVVEQVLERDPKKHKTVITLEML